MLRRSSLPLMISLAAAPLAAGCGSLAAASKKESRTASITTSTVPVAQACATPTPAPAAAGSIAIPVTGPGDQAALTALQVKCAACHTSTAPVLTTLANATPAKAAILSSLDGNRMPPSGSPGLTSAELASIRAWASASLALDGDVALLDVATAAQTWSGTGSGSDGIGAIMRDKCATCHSASAPENVRQAPYLSTYLEAKTSYLPSATRIAINSMPPAGSPTLAATDSTDIAAWAAGLFPFSAASLTHNRGKRVYYDATIKDIMSGQCTSCHGAGATAPDLSSFDAVKAAAVTSLASVTEGRMPPGATLDGAMIANLNAWIDANMEEADPSTNATGSTGADTVTKATCTP